jgi:uncharacterized protein YcbK (DUF882 family)
MLFALLPLHVVAAVTIAGAPPVEVTLYDANHRETYVVSIGRDGSIDTETREVLEHAFRCRRSEKEHKIDKGLLAMIADVQARWPGHTIEYISAYRGYHGERKTSPHRAGIALDFRVRGVKLTAVRDYVWDHFRSVGVGWYPGEEFVHMDHRDGKQDTAWTFRRGKNHYHPSWSKRVREKHPTKVPTVKVSS